MIGMFQHPPRTWTVINQLVSVLSRNNTGMLASAVAFYTFLSIFPALSALVSLYGLIADPMAVRTQMDDLREFVPPDALSLLSRWVDT
jgi:membrane protein